MGSSEDQKWVELQAASHPGNARFTASGDREFELLCRCHRIYVRFRVAFINLQTAGVSYTEQNQLHGQWREFRNAQKMMENDVKTILFSLAYLTLIKLLFYMSTGERERVSFSLKKKKKKRERKSKSVRNHFTVK